MPLTKPQSILVVEPKSYCDRIASVLSRLVRQRSDLSVIPLKIGRGAVIERLRQERPSVVISSEDTDWIPQLIDVGFPVVVIRPSEAYESAINIVPDEGAIGQLAADFFIKLGYCHFAYVGLHYVYSNRRYLSFIDSLMQNSVEAPKRFERLERYSYRDYVPETVEALRYWLDSLKKPIAVFAEDDSIALRVVEAAIALKVKIPQDVAVLGVNDDPFLSKVHSPSISSISMNEGQLFECAVDAAVKFMGGELSLGDMVHGGNLKLYARESTDSLASGDPVVSACLGWMRNSFSKPVTIAEMCDALHLARRTVERKFREEMQETPSHVLSEMRLFSAKRLLRGTDESIERIAVQCGFSGSTQMGIVFRRFESTSPGQYRKEYV